MSKADILNVHGEFLLIDSIAKTYPAYTHDEVFNLEYGFAMQLILKGRQEAYIAEASQDIQRKIENSKKN